MARTIESILKLCPNFLEFEEIRNNPINGKIQVRCSNQNCPNSKEKDGWYEPETRTMENRLCCLKNNKPKTGKFFCSKECRDSDENYKKIISENLLNYYKNLDPEIRRKKFLYPRKVTIEQIKERYPKFSEEEEIRYHPGKEEQRIIQGHCKYSECPNSKENGGWFDLGRRQLESRIAALEKNMSANLYLFCSKKCKISSKLSGTRKNSLQDEPEFKKYTNEVMSLTYYSVKENGHKIKNIELRGEDFHLDHKYSIREGFENNVSVEIISHWKNLEILSKFENISKHKKCSITLEQLLNEIKNLE